MRTISPGSIVVDHFPVFNWDGETRVSGETSFSVLLWRNAELSSESVSISEIGTTGEYSVSFNPSDPGFWVLEIAIGYNGDIYRFEYDVSNTIQDVYSMVRRLLGLSHENIFIDNTSYDANGQLISARVRLFDSKVNCDLATDGGSETNGLIATYGLTSTWDAINQFAIFKQTMESP